VSRVLSSVLSTIAVSLPFSAIAQENPQMAIATAILAGDHVSLERLASRGIVLNQKGDFVVISIDDLLTTVKGCGKFVRNSQNGYRDRALLAISCSGRESSDDRCKDVGYDITGQGLNGAWRLKVERDDERSVARCGALPANAAPMLHSGNAN